MEKKYKIFKRICALFIVVLLNFNVFATTISNDGSSFVTKSEFDEMTKRFNEQMQIYQSSLNSKIDTSISSYLAGMSSVQSVDIKFDTRFKNIRWIRNLPLNSEHTTSSEQNKSYLATKYNDGVSVNYYMVDYFAGTYRQGGTLNTSFTGGAKDSSDFTGWTNRPTINNWSWSIKLNDSKNFGYLNGECRYHYYYWDTSGSDWTVSGIACGNNSTTVYPEIGLSYDSYGRLTATWKRKYDRGTSTTATETLSCSPRFVESRFLSDSNPMYYMFGTANTEEYYCVPNDFTAADIGYFNTWFTAENAEIKNSSGTNILTNASVNLHRHLTNGPQVNLTTSTLSAKAVRSKKWVMRNWYNQYLKDQNIAEVRLYEGIPLITSTPETGTVKIDMEVLVYNANGEQLAEEALFGIKNDKWDNSDSNGGTVKLIDDLGRVIGNAERIKTSGRKVSIKFNANLGDKFYFKMYPEGTQNGRYVRISNMKMVVEK